MLFWSRRPLIHRLHERQESLMRNFLSSFLKQEIVKKPFGELLNLSLINEESQLNRNDIFIGKARRILEHMSPNDTIVTRFYNNVREAFCQCALYLQKKLPLDNELLRAASSLDPLLQKRIQLPLLKKLKIYVVHYLTDKEYDNYDLEVHRFVADMSLPSFDEEKDNPYRIDEWWACLNQRYQYQALCKVALTLSTIFHEPMVSVYPHIFLTSR